MSSIANDDSESESDVEDEVKSDLIYGLPIPEQCGGIGTFMRQLFAATSPILGSTCVGMTNGFTAVLVPKVPHILDADGGSWLAATVTLSMLAGNILSSFTMRFYGRKMNLIFSYIPTMIGWIYISFAINVPMMLLSGLLIGFGSGVNVPVGLVYYAETCEPKVRGFLLGIMVSSVSIGIFVVHILGILLKWRTACYFCAAIPTIAFCWTLFIPESPAWLLSKRRIEKARENFIWLRGFDLASQAEFSALVSRQVESNKSSWRQFWKNLFSMQFLKPFFLLILLFTVQQWSGLNVFIYHTIILLRAISSEINEVKCAILIDVLRIWSSLVGCYLLKVLRRRTLYFISTAGTVLSMIGVIVVLKFDLGTTLLIIALSCYIYSMHSGLVTLPWLMNSEVYPINIRDAGIVMSTVFAFILQFIMVKTSIPLIQSLGIFVMMSNYAAVVLVGGIILYFVMPETKNSTLQEAGDKLRKTSCSLQGCS